MFNSGSDPFIKTLKPFGYKVVRLPKADIQPLQILSKNGENLERLGAMTTLLTAGKKIAVPKISFNNIAAPINGQRTGNIKIGLGLSLLGNIIGALGGTTLGLETAYEDAKTASFEFSDVLEDKVTIIDIDQYLGDADINPASVYVGKLLEADSIFVITSVIKSKKFTFEAKDINSTSLKLNVPVIQEIVGGNLKVETQNQNDSKLTYQGDIPLIFGFQAIQLFYEDGRYTSFKPAGDVAMKSLPDEAAESKTRQEIQLFDSQSAFARLI